MNKWWQMAALAAAAAATVATGGAAAPALAGAAGAGTAGAAGAGAAGGLLGAAGTGAAAAGTGAAATGAGGLLGAGAGAAGAAGTGAATTGAGAGLLGNAGAAASYGTGLGTQQTAMLAAQEAGMGSMPISGSLFGNASSAVKTAKPFMDAAGTGVQVANAMTPQEQPTAPPSLAAPVAGMSLQQLAEQNQQAYTAPLQAAANARAARRQQRRGLLA